MWRTSYVAEVGQYLIEGTGTSRCHYLLKQCQDTFVKGVRCREGSSGDDTSTGPSPTFHVSQCDSVTPGCCLSARGMNEEVSSARDIDFAQLVLAAHGLGLLVDQGPDRSVGQSK